MNQRLTLTITILIILAIMLVLALKIRKDSNLLKDQKAIINSNNLFTSQFKILNNLNNIALNYDGLAIPNCQIINQQGEKFFLSEVLNSEKKLMVRFTQFHCEACIDFMMRKINKLEKEIGVNKILILVSYPDYQQLSLLKLAHHTNAALYNIPSSGLNIKELDIPYWFVTDRNLKISCINVPEKSFPELSDQYFNIIKSRFFPQKE